MEPSKRCRIIAIAGGSGSGKTTLARKIRGVLGEQAACILSQDSYYIDQSHRFKEDGGDVNFDHPDALDFGLLREHLLALQEGSSIEVPCYDFVTHKRLNKTIPLQPTSYILVDGTLILSQEPLRPLFFHAFFLDVTEKLRFDRRFRRDVEERGRTPEGVIAQFQKQVKPMHDLYVQPSLHHASRVVQEDQNLDEVAAAFCVGLL